MDWLLLTKLYLQSTSTVHLNEEVKLPEQDVNEDWQKKFLDDVINHPLCMKYPPSLSLRQKLIKMVVKMVETQGHEVTEELMEALGLVMAETNQSFSYKTYLSGDRFVPILESEMLASDGTTGLRTWSSSKQLAEYFIQNPEILDGKRVLELGSGIGLLGLLISERCTPLSFTFTDAHHSVLDKLASNIDLNHRMCSNLKCSKAMDDASEATDLDDDCENEKRWHWLPWTCSECGTRVCEKRVTLLDWETVDRKLLESLDYDVVVAADVIFDKELRFLRALRHVYDVTGDVTSYVANAVRREASIQAFLSGLDDLKLSVREEDMPGSGSLYWPRDHVHVLHVVNGNT